MTFLRQLALSVASLAIVSACQAEATGMDVSIRTTELGEQIELESVVESGQPGAYAYSLTVERISSAGTSTSRQGGTVMKEAGAGAVTLSRSRVNALGDGTLRATLTVTGPEGETGTSTIELTGSD